MKPENTDKNENARKQAQMQLEGIRAMVAALSVDYDRLEELKDKAMAGRWAACWNTPGCMPDSDPAFFEDWADACAYILNELHDFADQLRLELREASAPEVGRTEEEAKALESGARALENTDEGEDWGQTLGRFHYWITHQPDQLADEDEAAELKELAEAAGECESEDEARARIQEDALDVQIRSGWYAPGSDPEPEGFQILLCTGGPAVRIRGELNGHREPYRAWLEFQDWFTSWEELVAPGEGATEALLTYARCFHFGE